MGKRRWGREIEESFPTYIRRLLIGDEMIFQIRRWIEGNDSFRREGSRGRIRRFQIKKRFLGRFF